MTSDGGAEVLKRRSLTWGLNLMEPEVTTQEEIDEYRRTAALKFGISQPGLDFWLEMNPEVLKRYRLWADSIRIREGSDSADTWSANGIGTFYVNAITGFDEGLRYSLHSSNRILTKAQMLEQLALVSRYTGPRGMAAIAKAAAKHEWREPTAQVSWPEGWGPDPDAFKSGADFSSREASAEDIRKILDWHERWLGDVPRHVAFLARHRPELLKARRGWYENTLRLLPKQAEPYALIQISVTRGFGGGIREGVLLGRGFGMSKSKVLEAISYGTFYGGEESLSLADEVAGDVLDSWTE